MINYNLPTSVIVDNKEYPINKKGDYRVILDIIQVFNDKTLSDQEKAITALCIFFGYNEEEGQFILPENIEEALNEVSKFIDCGNESKNDTKPQPKLMDWEQDFYLIVPPLNKVLGYEVRSVEYLHWWTFIGAYMEIGGDCVFSQVKDIRLKRSKGEKLDKSEQAFFRENREMILFKDELSQEDEDWLNSDD